MKVARWQEVVALVILLALLPGCYGRRELEELSLVSLLGVDKGQSERLLVTVVIAVPRKARPSPGGAGGEGGGTEATVVLSAEANDILGALSKIDRISARHVTTMHTQVVVIGEELARDDVAPLVDVFSRQLEFRHNTLVAVAKGKAADFLKKVRSIEEPEPSSYLVKLLININREQGTVPLVTIHEFLIGYSTLESDPWAPYLGLAAPAPEGEEVKREQAEPEKAEGGRSNAEGKEQGKDNTRPSAAVLGSAVFRKVGDSQKMVGTLNSEETMATSMLKGDFIRGHVHVAIPGDPQETGVLMFHHFSGTPKVRVEGNRVDVQFKIRLTASLVETSTRRIEVSPELQHGLVYTAEDQLEKLLASTFEKLKSMGTDVIDLGMAVHRSFRTWPEWQAFNWPERFRDVNATFDVKVHVFTSGFTFRPPEPR